MTTLLVASTGGHLAELHGLLPRLPVGSDRIWLTFDSPQSRELLRDEQVHFAPPATTRDLIGTFRDATFAARLLRGTDVDRAISTGASIAVSVLPLARLHKIECHYIESATRVSGPSLSGRILAHVPGVNLYTQYREWANARWSYEGSVFDAYLPELDVRPPSLGRVVVTLGTHPRFGFRRLIERLVSVLPASSDVLWQVGATDVSGLKIHGRETVSADELTQAITDADLVVTHAGVGSAQLALSLAQRPVFVPRRHEFGEHVDDHQVALADSLRGSDLVSSLEVAQITSEGLLRASQSRVATRTLVPRFELKAQ